MKQATKTQVRPDIAAGEELEAVLRVDLGRSIHLGWIGRQVAKFSSFDTAIVSHPTFGTRKMLVSDLLGLLGGAYEARRDLTLRGRLNPGKGLNRKAAW